MKVLSTLNDNFELNDVISLDFSHQTLNHQNINYSLRESVPSCFWFGFSLPFEFLLRLRYLKVNFPRDQPPVQSKFKRSFCTVFRDEYLQDGTK